MSDELSLVAHVLFMDMPRANWTQRVLCVLGLCQTLRIEGESMVPTLKSGDTVLINRRAPLAAGDIVAAAHPFYRSVTLVKRVESIDNGRFVLKGDNPDASTDSRTFGSISTTDVIGKVICRL